MAFALVSNVARATGGANGGTSGAIDTTGATLLVLIIGDANVQLQSVSDSKGNVWNQAVASPLDANVQSSIWFACGPGLSVGAAHTFTVNRAGTFPTFCVAAFSGSATDFVNSNNNNKATTAGATSLQAGSVTPSKNNCLVIAAIGYRDTTALAINGGFIITDQCPFIGATAIGSGLGYLIQTTAAAANPTWSWTNSVGAAATIAYFQVPPASGGGSFAFS